VVVVHGCFWHGHSCSRVPRAEFWVNKIAGNMARDERNERRLRRMGWRVLTVRECRLRPKTFDKSIQSLYNKITCKQT
jgi:DNA mismatch endonuclease (patch repair protein)